MTPAYPVFVDEFGSGIKMLFAKRGTPVTTLWVQTGMSVPLRLP